MPRHPALRGVEELRAANFSRSVNVEPATEDRVLIRLADGTPLLLERAIGRGPRAAVHIVARPRVE